MSNRFTRCCARRTLMRTARRSSRDVAIDLKSLVYDFAMTKHVNDAYTEAESDL
ncbi:unnamed protein product [Haemonchus placei]|uniref:SAM-dependent methyltransferase n=1 Tax=Haemonchus placei TaxID=6290 RepID=A0A0N4WD18_HAEPC|nr:unnamed protein product [Haemonchus placei]